MSDLVRFEIPGSVVPGTGHGGLPKLVIETPWSSGEIYLHGAHVTHFQKIGEAPLLFMSKSSLFKAGQPIRGGVPVIFPWFGGREGLPIQGLARTAAWELAECEVLDGGAVRLRLVLPDIALLEAEFIVTFAETLTMELVVKNVGGEDTTLETCLHTYFQVGAIDRISIHGLSGASYFDQLLQETFTEVSPQIQIASEVDRIYSDTSAAVEIVDPGLGRRIRIEKSGSATTVVWNPWIGKSQRMPDFGDEEYLEMVCVESGNVGKDSVILPPGASAALKVAIGSSRTPSSGPPFKVGG